MHCPTVWVTEVEIFSAAQMLDTDIFFFSQGIVTNGCDFNLPLPLTVAATSILNSHYTNINNHSV